MADSGAPADGSSPRGPGAELKAARAALAAAERALARQKAQFERDLEMRTAALHKARVEAEAASESKSEFLATMSHEIRTPIHGIMGTLDLLLETQLDADQEDYLGTARSSAESLLRIINDILDFSKIEAGKLVIEPTVTELRALLEDVVWSLAPMASAKGLEVVCDVDRAIPDAVLVDPVRLRQILINLYGNAVKFTSRGQVVVSARLFRPEQGDPLLHIDVIDTGMGIEPERQRTLFDPFTQADGTTTRRFGGTGLGLAISLRLAVLMGGQIRMRSAPGQGSRFRVVLPLHAAPGADTKSAAAQADPPLSGRVLVVDDNNAARSALVEMLGSFGLEAFGAASAGAAAELVVSHHGQGQPFAAAFVDAVMPGTDGLACVRRLRKLAAGQLLPVGLLVGPSQSYSGVDRLGVSVTLSKPLRTGAVRAAARTLLGQSPPAASEVRPEPPSDEHIQGRVLLVDDNETNRKIAAAMVRKLGIEPDVATDGAEAVDAVRSRPYDLVLMDVQMPVMSGLEATRVIRELEGEARNVPIVALTANAMAEDRETCLSAGMDDYLAKPVRGKRLREVLRRWLSEASYSRSENVDPADTILRQPDSALAETLSGGGSMLEMLTRFQQSLDARVATFVELYKENDFRGLAAQAERIRHDAQHLGAARLASLAGLLEVACRSGDYESADRYARRLPRVARDTAGAIHQLLDRSPE